MLFSNIKSNLTRLPFLLLLAALVWGGEYLRRDLWEPDEARYAYVAAEMRDTGHQLIPYRNGEVYGHKPPLMFWLMQASSVFTGGKINGLAARLPSLLGGLVTLWCLIQLARRWYGNEVASIAVLVLMTTYLFWHQVGMGQIDSLLCGLEMLALYLLFTAGPTGWRSNLRLAGAYVCMGVGILAKGPVALLVPLLVYACSSWAAGEAAALKRWHWLWGLFLAALFPAAWLLAIAFTGAPDGYFKYLIFDQNIGRAAGELGHRQPFFYFLTCFPVDFLPWALFLPAGFAAWKYRNSVRSQDRRLLAWIAVVIVFFSLSPSKRNLYILLAYPAAALWIASSWNDFSKINRLWITIPAWLLMGLFLLLGLAGCLAWLYPSLPFSPLVLLPLGIGLLAGAGWLWVQRRELQTETSAWLTRLCVVFLALFIAVGSIVFPALNPIKTPAQLGERAKTFLAKDQRLLLYRIDGEIMALYAERRGLRVDTAEEARAFIQSQPRAMAVVTQRQWQDLEPLIQKPVRTQTFTMGSKDMIWLEFESIAPRDPRP
jgi:4-amino-4-deoxy-L-arabinose transferase-like glycosyltransferase